GGILFIVLGQMQSFSMICVFTYLLSFVNEAFRPANSTAIAFYSQDDNRTRSYALNRLAINIGWAVGSALGGVLAKRNYHLLFWVDGFTNIAAVLLMWIFLKPVNYRPAKQKVKEEPKVRSAYADKTYLLFVLITMLFASCFFQIFTNLPVFFKKELHFSEPFIGLLMAVNGIVIALVEMVLIYKLEGKRKHTLYITFGVALTGLSFLMLNIPGMGALLALVMIITITFGEIFAMPFMNTYWIGRTQSSNRGQYAALYTMAWSAAQCLGPLLGSQVADHYNFTLLWWIVGVLALFASFAFWKLHKTG
ncbi:MAG TPA: MFS transporter, partial [Chitinophagaceae bacterium]|nr:MFS transporter [Chitinophagaceae bacterium]